MTGDGDDILDDDTLDDSPEFDLGLPTSFDVGRPGDWIDSPPFDWIAWDQHTYGSNSHCLRRCQRLKWRRDLCNAIFDVAYPTDLQRHAHRLRRLRAAGWRDGFAGGVAAIADTLKHSEGWK